MARQGFARSGYFNPAATDSSIKNMIKAASNLPHESV